MLPGSREHEGCSAMSSSQNAFVSVASLFTGRSSRWVTALCRRGGLPGAVKLGGSWYIRPSDVERLAEASRAPSQGDAEADLRARGVL